MQATITYLLTEQAQRAQMAATGQPVVRKQTVTVDVGPEDLPLLAVTDEGAPYLDIAASLKVLSGQNRIAGQHVARWYESYNLDVSPEVPAYGADVLALIRQGMAEQTAKRVAKQEAAQIKAQATVAYNAAVSEWVITSPDAKTCNYWHDVPQAIRDRFPDADQTPELTPEASKVIQARADEAKRLADIRDAEKRAAEAAKEQVKTDYIAQWIAEHADEETRAQFGDGLLCRQSALGMIADAAFAAAGVPDKASYSDEFCQNSNCPCGEHIVDCLPTSVYPRWKTIKATLPEGYSVVFSRLRECLKGEDWDGEGESAGPTMYVAEIKLPHGPFTFERTIEL